MNPQFQRRAPVQIIRGEGETVRVRRRAHPNTAAEQRASRSGGFTLVEMLCVVTIIGILAALLLPAVTQGQARARRIQCVNNLKELGVAFHAFMHDHGGRFPMQTSMSEGGSLEFVRNGYLVNGEFYFSFRHFQALSDELVTPSLLVCPADITRHPAAGFASLQNENVSYGVGVNAEFSRPNSILAGDRNITNDWKAPSAVLRLGASTSVRWTRELHRFKGNLLFADGRVEELNEVQLAAVRTGAPVNEDLFLPVIPGPQSTAQRSGPGNQGLPASPGGPNGSTQSPVGIWSPVVATNATRGPTPRQPQAPGQGRTSPRGLVALPSLQSGDRSVEAAKPMAVATNAPTSAPPAAAPSGQTPDGSFILRWFADIAELMKIPIWLLYLFLLLLLAGLLAISLRRRWH